MKTEYQKCMDGEFFNGKDKDLAEMTQKAKRLLAKLRNIDFADVDGKYSVLREMLGAIGHDVQ